MSQLSRSSSSETQGDGADGLKSVQAETEAARSAIAACSLEDSKTSTSPSEGAEEAGDRPIQEIYAMWRVVKSPLKTTTCFAKGDAYLDETVNALSQAVELSEWENAFAVYDLALVYKSMGELERAKEHLEKMLLKEHCH